MAAACPRDALEAAKCIKNRWPVIWPLLWTASNEETRKNEPDLEEEEEEEERDWPGAVSGLWMQSKAKAMPDPDPDPAFPHQGSTCISWREEWPWAFAGAATKLQG